MRILNRRGILVLCAAVAGASVSCGLASAEAAEITLGGGYALPLSDVSSGLGAANVVTGGGVSLAARLLINSGLEPLKVGIETGYLKYSHAEYLGTGTTNGAYNREESNVPILAVGRYTFYNSFFGELKVGATLDSITSTLTTEGTHTTPYFALGAGIGKSFQLTSAFSIDPRLDGYMFFISGPYTQVTPSLNLSYHF